ncbi:Venom phosphodiesterase 2 [Armadillidium nasatum]|uniref:Venom phosphodiesterase 2 n=1 Tax=Armadillidium nasatum TaxID=96803 RepID=A0A5N5SYL6_9CRUS|nr:Venom phosphodiesterase 2 [Armadillidium nasatum]
MKEKIGVAIIGVCVLVFYLSAEAKKTENVELLNEKGKLSILATDEIYKTWRDNEDEECLISMRDSCPEEYGNKPVVLLVLGGLRIDQVSEIPALQEFVKCGSSAKSLVPSYPSFNYPNLYSIATGLYPESHGIISNEMYDDALQKNFTIDSPNSFSVDWWGGEPIWNTVGKAKAVGFMKALMMYREARCFRGVSEKVKKSATYLWPGSNVQIQDRYPTYWQKDKVDFITRIKKIVDWVDLPPNERPQLIMAYYEQPVKTSQEFGPFSPKTVNELSEINLGLDELMTVLDEEELINCVDIIVASDHGVAASACDDSIYIDELVDEDIPGRLYTGTVGRIDFADDADKDTVNRIIKKLKCTESSLRALEKNEVPIRYHYTNNPRIGDLILDAKSGSRIATAKEDKCLDGEFGYDILSRSMQGVFVAHGPSFRIGVSTDSYRNVEIYNLLNHLLEIEPAPNNGTRGSLLHLLRPSLITDDLFKKPEVSYLKESLKPFPSRPNNAVLGKYSEVDKNSVSCPCEQKTEHAPTHVEEIIEKDSSAAEVESAPVTTSTTPKSTTESSSSSSSSPITTEAAIDSAEVEVTSPVVEEIIPSASSRALNSDVALLDSVDISNITEESLLDLSDYDEPIVDLTDNVENYDESVFNSTLEGTQYVIDNTTNESENDSDSGMVETTEADTTFVHRLPEPRHIAEIILSKEDIMKAQENSETTPAVSFATESIVDDTVFEDENVTISDSNISHASILLSDEKEDDLLKENLEESQPSVNYEQGNNNDTTEELISETTTLEYTDPEEIPIMVTHSLNADDIENIHANSSDIESDLSLEPHTEEHFNSTYVKDLVPENVDTLETEIIVENVEPEHTTELSEEKLEIPVVSEPTNSSHIYIPESQVENHGEHTIVENNEVQETATSQMQPSLDTDLVIEPEEQKVPTTEITSLLKEDTVSETEITFAESSPSEQEPETVLETDVEEIAHIPETSTPIFESISEMQEIQAIPDPNENIALSETSTPTLESNSENLEALAIPNLQVDIEIPKTSAPSLESISEKADIQEVLDAKENIEILETSTPNLESFSEKSDIQEVVDAMENIKIPEASTPSLDSTSENGDVQGTPDVIENKEIPETSTPSFDSTSEIKEIQGTPDVIEDKGIPETSTHSLESADEKLVIPSVPELNQNLETLESSTPTSEITKEKIEILPIPESLKSMNLVKESNGKDTGDTGTISKLHCPWGFPSYSASEVSSDTLNILPHSSFPESLSLGVWTSFTLSKHRLEELHKARPAVPDGVYVSPEETRSKMPVGCWISDSRLQRSSSDQCSRTLQTDLYEAKNVSLRQLFPEDLEFPDILNKEGYLLSNLAPVMKGYEEGPRSIMVKAIKKWAKQKGPINVVHGPVFDHNNDGKRDNTLFLWDTVKPLIPSGYYFVVTLCNETKESDSSSEEHIDVQAESLEECPMANLNVYSFLFPNTPENDMCLLSPREYLQNYMASLADIEEITSIYFFKNMDYRNKVQIRARQPLRTPAI